MPSKNNLPTTLVLKLQSVLIFMAPIWKLRPGLILFPSRLTHMVETVKGEDTRISLSFNTFPVGLVGEEMDLTGLKLESIKE